jgi:hypothetical protein
MRRVDVALHAAHFLKTRAFVNAFILQRVLALHRGVYRRVVLMLALRQATALRCRGAGVLRMRFDTCLWTSCW